MVMHPKINNIIDFCNTYEYKDLMVSPYNDAIAYKMQLDTLNLKYTEYAQFYSQLAKFYYKENFASDNDNIFDIIDFCVLHSAQQFNFWYGTSSYKPLSSSTIHNFIKNKDYNELRNTIKNSCIGFIPERLEYLDETLHWKHTLQRTGNNLNEFIDSLLELESFNQDPLFKKGLLAIMEIRRILDFYPNKFSDKYLYWDKFFDKDIIGKMPIPADYRIPEYLAKVGLLKTDFLNKEYESNSQLEIAIRVATINEVYQLSNHTNYKTYELDSLIFMNKNKDSINQYHQCMTTSY
jgi:hypothetical protein